MVQPRIRSKALEKLYHSAHWHRLRQQHLASNPLCAYCSEKAIVTTATVVDHVVPHGGDPNSFYLGEFQSLCKPCHDSLKQQREKSGFAREIGADGFPVDRTHPFYLGGDIAQKGPQ